MENIVVEVKFSERFSSETRTDYLERVLNRARNISIEQDCPVQVKGYFFDADVERVYNLYHGLIEIRLNEVKKGLYFAVFTVMANFPHQ